MRYIGNKENLLDKIYALLQKHQVRGDRFFDFFSGTSSVARYFKHKGYAITSCDMLYLSYCLQKAYIENNVDPTFSRLLPQIKEALASTQDFFATPLQQVITYLNTLQGEQGFIYQNYTPQGTKDLEVPRMYFSSENGEQIDAIRSCIERWKQASLLTEIEYYILISCLLESVSLYSNVSGVYAAFYKKWDPRAIKPFRLSSISIQTSQQTHQVYWGDSIELLNAIETDILYLDPPYNARQYLPNYHLLETIALYDAPTIKGITGQRVDTGKKSSFCNAQKALKDLQRIVEFGRYQTLVLSYNSEGIMQHQDIIDILSPHGEVIFEKFMHLRFKSNSGGLSQTKKHIYEYIYILKR